MNESLLGWLLPDAEKGFEIKTHCNGRQCTVCLWHFVMQTWKNKTANHLFQSCLQSMSLHRSTPLPWWRRLPKVHQELSNMFPCLSFLFHISSKHIVIFIVMSIGRMIFDYMCESVFQDKLQLQRQIYWLAKYAFEWGVVYYLEKWFFVACKGS
jgi:hypothetical protein